MICFLGESELHIAILQVHVHGVLTNVHDFLLDQHLNQMTPICQEMDGERLMELCGLRPKDSA